MCEWLGESQSNVSDTFCCFDDSEDNLKAALSRMGLSSRGMEDVMDKVRNRHYQVINLN